MSDHLNRSVLASLALLALAGVAAAGTVAYDGFADGGGSPGAGEYVTGTASTNGSNNDSLVNQGPVLTGFAAADTWTAPFGGMASVVYFRAEGGGLAYTDANGLALPTTAGQAHLFRASGTTYYDKTVARASNDTAAPPQVMYVSALVDFQTGLAGRVLTQWGSKTPIRIGFDTDGHLEIGLDTNGNIKGTSASAYTDTTPHLVIAKIVDTGGAGNNDSVTLWVDPTDLSYEYANTPVLANVDLGESYYVADNAAYALTGIRLSGGVLSSSSTVFDELRVADTWRDAVGGLPSSTVHFQEGVAPTTAYMAASTTIRGGGLANSPQDDDPDIENIVGRVGSDFMRNLYEFDVSQIAAQGGTVEGVQLTLTNKGGGQGLSTPLSLDLHAYDFAFVEAAATWNDPDGDGGDTTGDPTDGGTPGELLGTISITASDTTLLLADTPAFRDALNAALASEDQTLRLLLKQSDESGSGNHFVRLWEERAPNATLRPELIVQTVPEPATMALLGLSACGLAGYMRKRRAA